MGHLSDKLLSIKRISFVHQFLLVSFVVFIFVSAWSISEYYEYKTLELKERERFLLQNKDRLLLESERIIDLIDYTRDRLSNDSAAKEYILDYVAEYRFHHSGYIFINNLKGKALVFEGRRPYNKSIKNLTDAKGKNVFQMELETSKKPNGGFMGYYFRKIGDTASYPKIAYVKLYKDFNWIIGAGDYLDEVHRDSNSYLGYFWRKFIVKIISQFGILLFIILLIYYLSKIIGNRFTKVVYNFRNYFDRKIRGENVKKLTNKEVVVKELSDLFVKLDEAIERKNQLEKERDKQSSLLENMVTKRTSELELKTKELDEKNVRLSKINDVFVDREFRIKELKNKIDSLESLINTMKEENK